MTAFAFVIVLFFNRCDIADKDMAMVKEDRTSRPPIRLS